MNDEMNTRAVIIESFFQRRPRITAVGANRIVKRFDTDGIQVPRVISVHESVEFCRWETLSINIQMKEEEEEEEERNCN